MSHIITERRLKAQRLAEQISQQRARRNKLVEILGDNGVSKSILSKRATSTEWMEEKARDMGLEVR